MGTSHHGPISLILEAITRMSPASVLDVGCGSGKWGVLCREYLRKARIEGVEGWPEYLSPVHGTVYDHVHVGDAREIVPAIAHDFELVLMVDVFEHFTREDGAALLDSLNPRGSALISVPATWDPQDDINGNAYEIHRAQYAAEDFTSIGFQVWRIANHIVAVKAPAPLQLRGTLAKWAATTLAPRFSGALVKLRDRVRAH